MPVTARVIAARSEARVRAKPAAERQPEARPQHATEHGHVLDRQRTLGNQAVQRLIRSGAHGALRSTPRPQRPQRERSFEAPQNDPSSRHETAESQEAILPSPSAAFGSARLAAPAAPTLAMPSGRSLLSLDAPGASGGPKVQRAWYNFKIPFTDYEFDPSIRGIKTAAGVVKDAAADALDWIVDQIKDLVASGMAWLREKAAAIEAHVASAFDSLRKAFTNILGFVRDPLGFIANALMNLDADAISNAWNAFSRLITTLSNGFKALVDNTLGLIGRIWGGINSFATSLLDRLSGLTQNFVFKRLPGALQSIAYGAIDTLKRLWKTINDGFNAIFGKLKAWIDAALDAVFSFVRKVLSFAINVVIDGIIQFGKIVLFLKDLFTNPQKYAEILAQKAVQAFDGVESRFAGVVGQHFSSAPKAASAGGGTRTIQREPVADTAERRRSASWSEIGSGVLEMMGKKWNEFKSNPMSVVLTLLLDMVLPIVGNVKDIIHLFGEIKKIVTGPLSAGSLEELWTSLLKILDIPILIYHTVVSILMRSLTLPLIVASFIPHPVVKAIAAAVGYALLAAFVQAELMNIGHKLVLLKTGATVKSERDAAYNRVADSLIAMAMTAVIVLVMIVLHFVANLMKGVYNFIRGKVFKAKPAPVETRAPAGEGKGGEGGKPGEGKSGKGEGKSARVEAEGPTRDGKGTIQVLDDGRVIVCRSCEELRVKYSDELNAKKEDGTTLTDEAQEFNRKVNEADAVQDPKDKKAAIEAVEDELAKAREARRATETVPVKLEELAKLRQRTGEAVERINPTPEKGKASAITEGKAKLLEGKKNLKAAQTEAAEAAKQGKPEAADLAKKATDMEAKLNELEKALGKAEGEHRDLQSEWKAAEEDARLIEGDSSLQEPGVIDEARNRLDNVRTRAELAEKKIKDALAQPEPPKEITIGGEKLKPSYGPEAQKFLDEHPNFADDFNKAMEKGLVPPKGKSGIVRSELDGYDYKLKVYGEGGNYRIHGRKVGDKIIWDKVTTHD